MDCQHETRNCLYLKQDVTSNKQDIYLRKSKRAEKQNKTCEIQRLATVSNTMILMIVSLTCVYTWATPML